MSAENRIEVQNLTKRFGSFVALDDATFSYEGNRCVGYLGPNGAGKTTTLKLLTNLLRPTRGQALINGVVVKGNPKQALRPVGGLIENPEPYASLRGSEALEMVGRFRGMSRAEIAARIRVLNDEFELPPLDRRVGSLSKGQRQRVVLAGTVINDPPILILDEPTSGLDPAERVKIRNFVLALKKDHLILMSSHLLSEVTETCDDVLFINHGKILLRDSVQAIESRTRSNLIEVEYATPLPASAFQPLAGLIGAVTEVTDRKYRFAFDGKSESQVKIHDAASALGPVLSFTAVGSPLEEMYMQLMVQSTTETPPPPSAGK
jgi:ABC-2 type transport system ATP-binding protein